MPVSSSVLPATSSALAGSRSAGRVLPRAQVDDIQRSRLSAGAVAAIDELGYEGATVGKITARARVSRRTFYELFAGRDECLAAVLEDVMAQVERELVAAVGGLSWRERVRTGLGVILDFLDREPALARVCVVQALRAGTAVQTQRELALARLAAVVDEGRVQGARGDACSELTAEGLVGAAFAIVHARVAHPVREPLAGLVGELMGMIVLPYFGPAAARRERERPSRKATAPIRPAPAPVASVSRASVDPLQGVRMRVTYRTAQVLEGVGELSQEGAYPSNREIAAFAGISDPGQISKLLRRLERLGLLENRGGGHAQGEPNAWRLTATGALVTEGIRGNTHNRREAA
jgi:AcrR family transcriptional regulator